MADPHPDAEEISRDFQAVETQFALEQGTKGAVTMAQVIAAHWQALRQQGVDRELAEDLTRTYAEFAYQLSLHAAHPPCGHHGQEP